MQQSICVALFLTFVICIFAEKTIRTMEIYSKIVNLLTESYMLEQLLAAGNEGITRAEITERWTINCRQNGREIKLSRSTFVRHLNNLRDLGFNIECDSRTNKHRITNASILRQNPVMDKMVNCLRDFNFVDRYRSLGDAIQPRSTVNGRQHLFNIGAAIESRCKLLVKYAPFDRTEYTAILHPYCLREAYGRWYLLAYKEDNEHGAKSQTFALDRMRTTLVTGQHYTYPSWFVPSEYFKSAYGIWVDEKKPAEDIVMLAGSGVSDYLTTLPLHPSQTHPIQQSDGRYLFRFHLSITPDFCNELQRWGASIEIVSPQHLREEMKERFSRALEVYK